MSPIDALIERSLREGPPAEPVYVGGSLILETVQPVRVSVRTRRAGTLGTPRWSVPAVVPRTRLSWAVALTVLLALAIAAGLLGARLTPPVGNGKIAFLVSTGGMQPGTDIYTFDPAALTAGTPNITGSLDLAECCLRWSPDGRLLAFSAPLAIGGMTVPKVVDEQGGHERQLSDIECGHLTWLPDGRSIACWSFDTLWLIPLDGDAPRGLRPTRPAGADGAALTPVEISPDGSKLLLELNTRPQPEAPPAWAPSDLFVLDMLNGELRRITSDGTTWEGQARWSPDGQTVAYATSEIGTGASAIEVVASDGRNRRVLVAPTAGDSVGSPVWSPTGAKLLYELRGTTPGKREGIWTVNADGSNQALLAPDLAIGAASGSSGRWPFENLSDSAWSPDGKLLVVHHLDASMSPTSLFTIDSDGGNLTPLLDCLCQFDWQPRVGR